MLRTPKGLAVVASALAVAIGAGVYGATTPTSGWSGATPNGKLPGPYQGVQDTAHMGATSVGSHTVIVSTQSPGQCSSWCQSETVFADSTGNPLHKSRAELSVGQANSGVVNGRTTTYTATITIPSTAGFNRQVCGWREVWQFATGLQFHGPNLELINVGGRIDWGARMWKGTAGHPTGYPGVNPKDLGPVTYDVPHVWVETVKWSPTATGSSAGSVSYSLDGKVVFSLPAAQTMPTDLVKAYWKLGVYQHDGCNGSQIISNVSHT